MKVHCTYDELKLITELKFHPDNANVHPAEQIERLASILEYQGFRTPIIISKRSGYVVAGHGRILAASMNGWEAVPVNYQIFNTVDEEIAHLHADNAIAAWADLSLAKVNITLEQLGPDFDFNNLGLKNFNLDPAIIEDEEQAEKKDKKEKWISCPNCHERFKEE